MPHSVSYDVTINYTPSNIDINMVIGITNPSGAVLAEATSDTIFQALLNKIVLLPNTTLTSAVKTGNFSTPVTSP